MECITIVSDSSDESDVEFVCEKRPCYDIKVDFPAQPTKNEIVVNSYNSKQCTPVITNNPAIPLKKRITPIRIIEILVDDEEEELVKEDEELSKGVEEERPKIVEKEVEEKNSKDETDTQLVSFDELEKSPKKCDSINGEKKLMNGHSSPKEESFIRKASLRPRIPSEDGEKLNSRHSLSKKRKASRERRPRAREGATFSKPLAEKQKPKPNVLPVKQFDNKDQVEDEPSSSSGTSTVKRTSSDSEANVLLKKLLKVCQKAELGDAMQTVEKKMVKYLSQVSDETTANPHFLDLVKKVAEEVNHIVISAKSELTMEEKYLIIGKIKEVFHKMKTDDVLVDKKLNQLYVLFNQLQRMIEKLEVAEVESDDEYENPYILLDRYRQKATLVYARICQLEGKAPHADRQYLQRFTYSGKGPIQVQRALEKHYNSHRVFPNFSKVYKITKKANDEGNLGMSEDEIKETARTIFIDFGKKLQLRRQYDDYHIYVGYIEEGSKDPAQYDLELQQKLKKNSVHLKKEQEVIDAFVVKQNEEARKARNARKNVALKQVNVVSESENESESNIENESEDSSTSDTETETDEKENTKDECEKTMFSDSDEELLSFNVNQNEVKKRKFSYKEEICEKITKYNKGES